MKLRSVALAGIERRIAMTETSSNFEGVGTTAVTRSIIVSLPKHEIVISENGKAVRTITDFSTGRAGHLTPLISNGKLDPVRRERMHYSSKYKDKSGKGAAMPFALFFAGDSGCAFHAGDPDTESHGCIHLN